MKVHSVIIGDDREVPSVRIVHSDDRPRRICIDFGEATVFTTVFTTEYGNLLRLRDQLTDALRKVGYEG